MKVLYVRHGKSTANAEGTIGVPKTKLAVEGIEQAIRTGRDLQDHNVTKIVCSPFIRAQQTAEIIAGELGIALDDIEVIDELHERRMGDLEGRPKRHETVYFYENDTEHGFESQQSLIRRMQAAVKKIKVIAQKTSGTTVVVGHAASGFYFVQVAKGNLKFTEFDPVSQMDNAEFIKVTFTE